MFEDNDWVDSALQDRRYREWTSAIRWLATETRSASNPLRVAILEVGAGGNVTTVRHESEHVFRNVDAVRRIDACLRERRPDLFDEAYTPLEGYEAIGEELGDIRLDE